MWENIQTMKERKNTTPYLLSFSTWKNSKIIDIEVLTRGSVLFCSVLFAFHLSLFPILYNMNESIIYFYSIPIFWFRRKKEGNISLCRNKVEELYRRNYVHTYPVQYKIQRLLIFIFVGLSMTLHALPMEYRVSTILLNYSP